MDKRIENIKIGSLYKVKHQLGYYDEYSFGELIGNNRTLLKATLINLRRDDIFFIVNKVYDLFREDSVLKVLFKNKILYFPLSSHNAELSFEEL